MRVWFFDKFENIIDELKWWANFNFENLSCKYLQIWYFSKLYIKIRILGQNSFEGIAFC